MAKRRGAFLVLEGPDKSGKSTQALRLVAHFKARGIAVVHTREPGGTHLAEAIRKILLDPKQNVDPLAELFLYEASRAQHTREIIMPALSAGTTVVSERYALATLAYQGYGRGLSLNLIRTLNRIATGGLKPDLTIVLDIPDREFGARRPGAAHDRLENASSDFRARMRRGYRRLARSEKNVVLLNGRLAVTTLAARIARYADPLIE